MPKFRVLDGSHAEESVHSNQLKNLSIEQLKDMAAEMKLDLDSETDPEAIKTAIKSASLRCYKKGEVFHSHSDLTKLNGPNSRKFERIEEEAEIPKPTRTYSAAELQKMHQDAVARESRPVSSPSPQGSVASQPPKTQAEAFAKLDKMSLTELQQVAAEEEIDLKGVSKREDVLKILKSQLAK